MDGDFDQISATKGTARDQQIDKLEIDLQREKDGRQEDRFVAILCVVIVIDLAVFPSAENWGAPIAILILELFLLIALAKRMGVDVIVTWLDKILNAVGPNNNPK
ncbi:MAG: hypothetical protein COB33_000450 [Thiotrichaceae bacterium]|nr:hypothetical protein [Thiotrichaceae bacterium]PCI10503.1 MAG: hypothetical protein COB71_12925 [Thiotrichales bacterium]